MDKPTEYSYPEGLEVNTKVLLEEMHKIIIAENNKERVHIESKFADIHNKLVHQESAMKDLIHSEIHQLDKKFKMEVNKIEKSITNETALVGKTASDAYEEATDGNKRIAVLEKDIKSMLEQTKQLEESLDDCINRNMRGNLILKNVPESK